MIRIFVFQKHSNSLYSKEKETNDDFTKVYNGIILISLDVLINTNHDLYL